jgi:hypothetical protein
MIAYRDNVKYEFYLDSKGVVMVEFNNLPKFRRLRPQSLTLSDLATILPRLGYDIVEETA